MATERVTAAEHHEAYQQHRARADELKVQIDLNLMTGMDSHEHAAMVAELHDELMCASKHFVLAALTEEATR